MTKVIGVENVDYVNKDNKRVLGVRLHVASELPPSSGDGFTVNSYFIRDASSSLFHIGEIVTLLFEPTFNGGQRCTGVLYKDDKK